MSVTWLKWIERTLLIAGVALLAWSAAVFTEARFFAHLPPPRAHATTATVASLPGDAGSSRVSRVDTGAWLAQLEAPSVGLKATVLEGADDTTLARGAGHIEDTPLPGQDGNIGIAGHRDTTFRAVRNLKVGDPLVLVATDRIQRFRIVWTKIVEPEDVYVLDPTPHPSLTLVTCYPFEFIGHAPHRFIVRAELVSEEKRTAQRSTQSSQSTQKK